MTIASVLRLNGVDVERTISPTGKVIFHTPGSHHPAGAPLKPHTFHGGQPSPDDDHNAGGAAWWLGEGAMDLEDEQMSRWYPNFTKLEQTPDSPPAWVGEINTERGRYTVVIAHRHDHGLPDVIPLAPTRFSRRVSHRLYEPSPHFYVNGRLCVAAAEDWDSATDTAGTVAGWAAHWASMHAEWRATGKWPTQGYQSRAA